MARSIRLTAALVLLLTATPALAQPGFTLSPADVAGGWEVLFDGTSTDAWRGYRKEGFPEKGWVIEEGCLKVAKGGGGGDIVTRDQYGDFEMELDWKVSPKGNSGIMYRVTEIHAAPWQTGPEYQILDDAGHGLEPTEGHSAGALYDLAPPSGDKVCHPAGQWNHTRIRCLNDHLEHWLNGVKVVDCRMAGPEWAAMIAKSKFKVYEGFGLQPTGHIALQDHGNDIWFRNIKVRNLTAPLPNEKRLLRADSLEGWTAHLNDGAKLEDVFSVDGGILKVTGKPAGYIRTTEDFDNFVLMLEWMWPDKPANSGVLFRMTGEDKVWPNSIEAQLMHQNAGDFWNIGEFAMKTDPERTIGRNTKKTHGAEYPVGEWNHYEIIADHGTIILKVNGQELNRATEAAVLPGKICLQSEGAPIHFRNVRLAPIP